MKWISLIKKKSIGELNALNCMLSSEKGFHSFLPTLHLSKGILLADVVSIIGTLDIVFGEIDR